MNSSAILERRYRRLLAWYPAAHRQAHQDEMLGVLMAAAPAGRRRPSLADTSNLIWGALRIRAWNHRPSASGSAWGDALAVLTVVVPILLVTFTLGFTLAMVLGGASPVPVFEPVLHPERALFWQLGLGPRAGGHGPPQWFGAPGNLVAGSLVQFIAQVVLLIAVLAGLRRIAIAAAVFLALAQLAALVAPLDSAAISFSFAEGVGFLGAYAVLAVALAATADLRRGRQLLRWKHVAWPAAAMGLPLVLVALALPALGVRLTFVGSALMIAALAIGGIAVGTVASKSRLDKRISTLLLVVTYTLVMPVALAGTGTLNPSSPGLDYFLVLPAVWLPALLTAVYAASACATVHRQLPRRPVQAAIRQGPAERALPDAGSCRDPPQSRRDPTGSLNCRGRRRVGGLVG